MLKKKFPKLTGPYQFSIEPPFAIWASASNLEYNSPSVYRRFRAEVKEFLAKVDRHVLDGEFAFLRDVGHLVDRSRKNGMDDEKTVMAVQKLDKGDYIDNSIVLLAVYACVNYGLKVPPEIGMRFVETVDNFFRGASHKTLDGAFSIRRSRKYHAAAAKRELDFGNLIVGSVNRLRASDNPPAIDEQLFDLLGKKFGVSTSTTRNYYYRAMKRDEIFMNHYQEKKKQSRKGRKLNSKDKN